MADTSPPSQENNNSLPYLRPAYTNRNLSYTRFSFPGITAAPSNLPWSLLSFLSIAQNLNIDFLPITWAHAPNAMIRGGTSEIHQSLVNVEMAFVYKRLIYSEIQEERAFQALIAEISILRQGQIRRHRNIMRLEGVCWDVVNSTDNEEKAWPVLVFEKAEMGSLNDFMKGKGKNLGFEERLELCRDVGRGIWAMHQCSITHGDIKPQNVLIFQKKEEGGGGYTAKVTDFGYSVMFRNTDSLIYMPTVTPYWNAPEWHHRGFSTNFAGAMKMDAYSFGLLCLWLLFYAGKKEMVEFYEESSLEETKLEIARKKVEEVGDDGLDREAKGRLRRLFERALAREKEDREEDFGELLELLAPHRAKADAELLQAMDDLHISSSDGFQLARSIAQLYLPDFRVRTYIASCLRESISRSSPTDAQNAAIQLALCYKLGFGVPRDEGKASDLMRQINKQPEDLQPIVDEILEHGSDVIFHDGNYKNLTGQGFVYRLDYGQYYREQQQFEKVEQTYKREINDLSTALGVDNSIIESLKTQLSAIYFEQGRWGEAETLQQQILENNTRLLGPNASGTQFSKAALAQVYRKQGKWAQAESLQREVLEIRKRVLRPSHPHTLSVMVELASTIRRQGQHDEARRLEEEVVEMAKQVFGPEHKTTLTSMANLASTYREEGRWSDAEKIQVQVLEISKQVLGEEHPDTLTDMGNLASTYVRLGDFAKAEERQVEVLKLREKVLGPTHPDTLASKSGLSFIYRSKGRLDEADELDFEVLDDSVKVLGPDHPDTLSCMGNVAAAWWSKGQWEKAEVLERQVADRTLRLLGPDHPDTLISQGNLAATYRSLGRWDEAEKLEIRVLEGRRRLFGEEHQDTLTSKENLAVTWENLGRFSEAEELERGVLEAKRRIMGEDHVQTILSRRNLATMYVDQERWSEAVALAEPALERVKEMLGEEHPIGLACMRSLTLAYLHLDRISEAESFAQLTLEIGERVHGRDHPDTILARRNLSLVLAAAETRLREAVRMQEEVLEEC